MSAVDLGATHIAASFLSGKTKQMLSSFC